MTDQRRIQLEDGTESRLAGLIPSIPDVLGWILIFLLLWAVYTLAVRGFNSVKLSPTGPEGSVTDQTLDTKIESDSSRPLRAAQKVIDTTIDDLSNSVSRMKERLKSKESKSSAQPQSERAVDRF